MGRRASDPTRGPGPSHSRPSEPRSRSDQLPGSRPSGFQAGDREVSGSGPNAACGAVPHGQQADPRSERPPRADRPGPIGPAGDGEAEERLLAWGDDDPYGRGETSSGSALSTDDDPTPGWRLLLPRLDVCLRHARSSDSRFSRQVSMAARSPCPGPTPAPFPEH